MKKLIALTLCLCTLLSFSTSALASTITEGTGQSANMTVRYGVDVNYTISIPETVTIGADGTGSASYVVSDAMIPVGENIYITTDSANRVNDTFYLTNTEETSVKVPYEIATGGIIWDDNVHNRTFVYTQEELLAGTATRNVSFRLLEPGKYSGTYNDTLTTTVAVGYALYGARQFPEDHTQIVWPADDDKWLENNSLNSWYFYEEVNVYTSKTNEWYPGFAIEWRDADPNDAGYASLPDGKYRFMHAQEMQNGQLVQDRWTGLYDAGYWGNFTADRLLYFGEEFQLVSKDFYDFIMTNTQPYNWFDYYQPITGKYQMIGDMSLPTGDYGCQVYAIVNGQYEYLAISRADSAGIPTVIYTYDPYSNPERGYVPMLLYFEGIGWVEPAAFSFDDMDNPEVVATFLASLVPASAPHTIELNDAVFSTSVRDFVMPVLQSVIITFTINDTTYQAEEGMTWTEWLDSEYNTDGYFLKNAYTISTPDGAMNVQASLSDTIRANDTYDIKHSGGAA